MANDPHAPPSLNKQYSLFNRDIDSEDDSDCPPPPPPPPCMRNDELPYPEADSADSRPSRTWRRLKREAEHALVPRDEEEAGADEIEVQSPLVLERVDESEDRRTRRSKMMKIGLLCLLGLAAIAGVVAYTQFNDRSGSIAGIEGTGTGTGTGTTDGDDNDDATKVAAARLFIGQNFPEKTADSLDDPESFASKALDWILNDPVNDGFNFGSVGAFVNDDIVKDFIQRFAAATLFHALSDGNSPEDDWKSKDGWLTTDDICSWHGVVCDDDGTVTQLQMSDNNVSGPIPTEIALFTNVETLFFEGNWITGPIPDEIYSMTGLTNLDFYDNVLTGQISPLIGNLENLEVLYLGKNNLDGNIPSELATIESLDTLWLNGNNLEGGIPAELANLSNLIDLDLDGNNLGGQIPAALGNLQTLEYLSLQDNNLTGGVPASFGQGATPPLKIFAVDNNFKLFEFAWAKGFPTNLLNIESLEELSLENTKMQGELPLMENLSAITRINLNENDLTGRLPTQYGDLSTLQEFSVKNNILSGELPSTFGDLTSLEILDLSGNTFGRDLEEWQTGNVPGQFGSMVSLESLNISGNWLTGELPGELGSLTKLKSLIANGNMLEGEIPEFILAFTNIEVLHLQNNNFDDSDGPSGKWSNGFSGDIPMFLSALRNLSDLRLEGNDIGGQIPDEICSRGLDSIAVCGVDSCEGDDCCTCA